MSTKQAIKTINDLLQRTNDEDDIILNAGNKIIVHAFRACHFCVEL